MMKASSRWPHVVVAGGSFAGLAAAYTIRGRMAPECRVTLVAPDGYFVFAPSLVGVALGSSMSNTTFALEPALASKGIEFIQSHVRAVNPAGCLQTDDDEIEFDRLVIATGGRPDTHAIPGLAGEFRSASWIVGEASALEARNAVRRLIENPGPVVIGAAAGASYMGGAYELGFAIDRALRRAGKRDRAPMSFVTFEPYLGHLGFGQNAARQSLEDMFGERGIVPYTGVTIDQVTSHSVVMSDGTTLDAALAVVMPPMTGSVEIWKSVGLTDETGMIPVNAQYRHVEHDRVYAVGGASYFMTQVPPLEGNRAPQSGYLSTRMGAAAGENVAASLGYGSGAPATLPKFLDVRVIDAEDSGLLLTSRGRQHLAHTATRLPGRTAHYLKASIQRYLLWRLRTGRMNLP